MPQLRAALVVLLDESDLIKTRMDKVGDAIKGMGKAIITAILTVAYPAKYGVWNSVSAAGLVSLGIWPEFERGDSFGTRYDRINTIFQALADAVGIDLWTLDAVWWHISLGNVRASTEEAANEVPGLHSPIGKPQFGMERHLHDFLYDNWSHTSLNSEWKIFTRPGEPDAGYELICPVGRIDILARHCTEKKWLVVELKRNDSSDVVVGQILRYMGWVRKNLAEPGDEVRGLIISRIASPALEYAISAVPGLDFMSYEVEFRLNPASA